MQGTALRSLFLSPRTSVKEAMQQLSQTAERILLVVNDQTALIGTVTDGDIRRALLHGLGFAVPVEKVMCRKFSSLPTSASDLLEQAKALMIAQKINHIPILDSQGILVDLILWTDVFEVAQVATRQTYPHAVVIMAGGKGTRLDPFTKILPKPLVPVGEKAIVEHIMERFYKSGFSRFLYTLNYKKEYIKLFLKEFQSPYTIDWFEEEDFLDTAGSLGLLKHILTERFFLVNCDSLIDIDFVDVLRWHEQEGALMTVVGCHKEVRVPFGVLQCRNGSLESIVEKPVHDVTINTGLYLLEPAVLNLIPAGSPMPMNVLIERVMKQGKVTVYPIREGWLDIGQWEEYRRAVDLIEGKRFEI